MNMLVDEFHASAMTRVMTGLLLPKSDGGLFRVVDIFMVKWSLDPWTSRHLFPQNENQTHLHSGKLT